MLPALFDFRPGEVVASLGCGGGAWEIGWMFRTPDLTCYLVDTDPELLNQEEVAAGIRYWERQYQSRPEARFIPVTGTAQTVPLDAQSVDKVLILNALHEFDFPDKMLAEVRRILRPGGVLFIEEEEARFPGERHEGCGRLLFSFPGLQQKVTGLGFTAGPAYVSGDRAQILIFYPD